jgi:hypothetical protein
VIFNAESPRMVINDEGAWAHGRDSDQPWTVQEIHEVTD